IETARRLGISERTLRYRLAKAREQGDDLAAGTGRAGFADRAMSA
ncbi:helix-turn-helix domain-containing protein, partial [Sphingomonas sp. CCH9-F2]